MNSIRNLTATIVVVLGLAGACWSQGMMRPPNIPGEFKPVVGSGAQYQMSNKSGGSHSWAWAVVGKESVDGQDGYWLEMRSIAPQGGNMIMKQLMVVQGGTADIKRMIMQAPGRPPMEMPVGMMHVAMQRGEQQAAASPHGMGELVGAETVTVPAGTFETQHYRSTDNGVTVDVWASTKVSPYGMIKMTSSDGTSMVLEKVLEHETSQITGEPQKMDFPLPGRPH
ncbi:MAG TPA: hypothetical protein VGZ29_00635 [Terriglobia bacterium]|nr:hypothetical protein [Terriglobia bacterium]